MSSPDDYVEVYGSVAAWGREASDIWWPPQKPWEYFTPLLKRNYYNPWGIYEYKLNAGELDPLLPDIKTFWADITYWVTKGWGAMATWAAKLNVWIEYLWNTILSGLAALATTVANKITGLSLLIGNLVSWFFWELYTGAYKYVSSIFKPLTDAWYTMTSTLSEWFNYIWEAITNFLQEPVEWMLDLAGDLWDWLKSIRDVIWDSVVWAADIVGGYIGSKLREVVPYLVRSLEDAALWLWDAIKRGFLFVVEDVVPAAYNAASGALGYLKDEFTNLIGLAYDEIMEKATSLVPVTPERSAGIAAGMFGTAVGFGTMAHLMALAVEAVPNLKYMGVHYLSAFAARMGSFGTISSATMGVIAGLAIKEPFTYYMNSILRPAIPDDKLLIEFRAKRDLTLPQFKTYMKYHGYTDAWIETIDSWLWKDPRLFEILYCADVTVPPTEWLQRKFERAGYEDIDISTLIKVVERRTTRSPRTYYTTSLRRNFRHGFLTEGELVEGINALEMAPDAIDWIKRAGELDNIYEVNSDWVTTFKTAFRNDILTEDELSASLVAIGLPWDRVEAITELEFVRKQPRILEAERKEIETQWREVQGKYSKVYIESFRRGLITEVQLVSYLVAIGIKQKVASMTARHEVIKLVPKPKPEAIPIPAIPLPPEPPRYED